jgi:hypothetical protein
MNVVPGPTEGNLSGRDSIVPGGRSSLLQADGLALNKLTRDIRSSTRSKTALTAISPQSLMDSFRYSERKARGNRWVRLDAELAGRLKWLAVVRPRFAEWQVRPEALRLLAREECEESRPSQTSPDTTSTPPRRGVPNGRHGDRLRRSGYKRLPVSG